MLEPPQLGGSNEYLQSVFWSENEKKVYPCKPQFYFIKVGCKWVFLTQTCFHNGVVPCGGRKSVPVVH